MYVASMNTRRSSVGVGVVDGESWVTSYAISMKFQLSPVLMTVCVCVQASCMQ